MTIVFEERLSDSPYVESVTHGYTASTGSTIRPAETHWHMVFTRHDGQIHPLVVGPLTASGVVSYDGGAEILWIKFKLGVFMPGLPIRCLIESETPLPQASQHSFWLNSSTWEIPNFENADTFVDRLAHDEVLLHDPVIAAALNDQPQNVPARTIRHRFLRATGMPQNHIRQFQRARHAETLLRQGMSILDTVEEAGYFDQPHLTRALKHWVGYTPAQLVQLTQRACQTLHDTHAAPAQPSEVRAAL